MRHQSRQRLRASVRVIAIAGAALAVGACGGPTTTLDQSWAAPAVRSEPPLQRVVTLYVGESVMMRHAAEDELARDLRARGVDATPAYAILGDQPVVDLEVVKTTLGGLGYDGLVAMRIIDRENTLDYAPGATHDGYWGSDYAYSNWGSDYVAPQTIYRIETVAYSLRTGKLVWSGMTKSIEPDTSRELIDDSTNVIAGALTRHGLGG